MSSTRNPNPRSVTLSPDLAEVARGRRFISDIAFQAGFTEERIFDISVACSEAMANAIEHSPVKGEIHVNTLLHPDRLEVEVEGPGEFQAPDRQKERNSRGMGLPLMAKLSDHLALFSGPRGGTLVALTFYLPGAQVDEGVTPPWITEVLEKNELVAGITGSVPVGLYVVDPDLRYRWANAAYQGLLEEPYRSRPLEGAFVRDVIPGFDEDKRYGLELLRQVSQTGEGMFFPEHGYRGFSRGITYWRRELIPLKQHRAEPPYDVLVVVSEITEQVLQRERERREHDETAFANRVLHAFVEHEGDEVIHRALTIVQEEMASEYGVFGYIAEPGHLMCPSLSKMLDTCEIEGKCIHYPPEKWKGLWAQALTEKRSFFINEPPPVPPGHPTIHNNLATPILFGGEAIGLLNLANKDGGYTKEDRETLDRIAGRIAPVLYAWIQHKLLQAEAATAAERRQLSGLLDMLPVYTILIAPDHHVRFANQFFEERFGKAEGRRCFEYLFGRIEPCENCETFTVLETHSPHHWEWTGPDGRHYDIFDYPFTDATGETLIMEVGLDITERVQAERELRESRDLLEHLVAKRTSELAESEQRQQNMLDCMLEGFAQCEMIYDSEGSPVDFVYLAVNPAFTTLTGLHDVVGKPVTQVIPGLHDQFPELLEIYGRVAAGGKPERFDIDFTPLNKWLGISVTSPVAGQFVAVFEDITERRAAEQGLAKAAVRQKRDLVAMTALQALGTDSMQQTDLVSILETAVETAIAVSEADFGTVQLLDPESGDLRIVAQRGFPEWWLDYWAEVSKNQGACGTSLVRGERVVVEDVEESPVFAGTPDLEIQRRAGVRAVQSTPISSRTGEPIGVFSTLYRTPCRPDERTERLLDLLASQIAEIVLSARAEEALRQSEERYRLIGEENERLYRQQLDIAEYLQLALLNIPSEIGPVRVGHLYRSATEAARVGGDFYDVFEIKGGKIAVLVGDVSGHGIAAARSATLVKDVIHAFSHQSTRPHEVLRRTNALLVEKDLPGFVSLFLGILDAETGTLSYASAGHPETLLRRTSREIQLLGSGSSPLGIYADASWKPGIIELEPEDVLLLYTDGVIEARRNGELFGQKRLESILRRKRLSVGRLPHMVLDQVLSFSGGRLTDDVAVLAVAITDKIGTKPGAFIQERLLG